MALDTNWRENGGVFVCSRSGNDSNAGTQSAPKETIEFNDNLVVRTGYYKDQSAILSGDRQMVSDGYVILDPANILTFASSSYASGLGKRFYGFTIFNINEILATFLSGTRENRSVRFYDCRLISCNSMGLGGLFKTFLKSCSLSTLTFGNKWYRNTLIDTTINFVNFSVNPNKALKSFFNENTVIRNTTITYQDCAFGATATNQCSINSVNIKDITLDGEANTIGNIYGSNVRFSGTATVGGDIVTFTNCFYTDNPMFNDADNEDYTLQSNLSPLFNNSNIIGCYGVADKFDLSHPAFQTANGATYTNISGLDANGDPVGGGTPLGIASGTEARFSTSNDPNHCFTLSDTITITDPVQWFGQFIYNNGQWIDTANYNELTNLEVRLTYGIQFYDENEPNSVNTENWSKTYQMEVNMPIERDGSASGGLGNGNVDADLQNLGAITFKRFRLVDVTLRNKGV